MRDYWQGEQIDEAEVIREAPVSNIVSQLLEYAVKMRASDIHIEPEEAQVLVRYRIDGILHDAMVLPKNTGPGIIARIKVLSNLKLDEKRVPQDGRFKIDSGGPQWKRVKEEFTFAISVGKLENAELRLYVVLPEG